MCETCFYLFPDKCIRIKGILLLLKSRRSPRIVDKTCNIVIFWVLKLIAFISSWSNDYIQQNIEWVAQVQYKTFGIIIDVYYQLN